MPPSRLMHAHGELVPSIFPFISYVIALEPNEVRTGRSHEYSPCFNSCPPAKNNQSEAEQTNLYSLIGRERIIFLLAGGH